MKSQRFEEPRLYLTRAAELSLSGQALLELMRSVLARGVPFRFCARGWSMSPFIRDGDLITISPIGEDLPGIGEVVAFVRPGTGSLVVHRVIATHGTARSLQGDSVPACPDGIIPPQNLLGRVTRVERQGRDLWLGLGPERYLLAWLSRNGWLIPLRDSLASWLKPLRRSRP